MRLGELFGELGDDDSESRPAGPASGSRQMDANKDGVITLEEFLARRDPTLRPPRQEQRRLRSMRADFEAAAKESTDYRVKRFLKRFDADRDGKVSKEEFAKARQGALRHARPRCDGGSASRTCRPGMRERVRPLARGSRTRTARRPNGRRGRQRGPQGCRRGRASRSSRLLGRDGPAVLPPRQNGDGFIDAKDYRGVGRRARRLCRASASSSASMPTATAR